MARIRTIKPEFWQDEDLSELPAETHLLAAALLNHADDEGYFKAHPKLIEAACCPLRDDSTSVRRSLDELSRVGYITLYRGDDGKEYGHIRNFTAHQRVDRPQVSKIRPRIKDFITIDECSTNDRRTIDERSTPEQGTGNREQGRDLSGASRPSERDDYQQALDPAETKPAKQSANSEAFERWWKTLPSEKKVKKRNAYQIWRRKQLDGRADELIADVQHRLANDRRWIEGYIPDPTTYLNQERWNDAVQQPRYERNQNEEAGEEFLRRIGANNA